MNIWKKISFVLSITIFGVISYFLVDINSVDTERFAFAQTTSLTIITLSDDNTLLNGGEYSITPDPFKMIGTYIVKDDSVLDVEKDNGIITITGIKSGNYNITQINAPIGYNIDKFSKMVDVKDSSEVVSFTNTSTTSVENNSIRNITYTAKFVCGSVFGDEGPLRPGHYDTDISILNNQNFPITLLWNIVINDGLSSNAVVKSLDRESSTGIVCKQIRELFNLGNNNEKVVEGFAIIRIQLDSMLESGGKIIRNLSGDEINLLDVHVFYTANALSTLPHEVIIDKISFYIIQDETGRVPKEMIRKTLDVSIPSKLNEISSTEDRVKDMLIKKYDLSTEDSEKIVLRIKNISVGVGTLIDDHAISLHVVKPQASS